MRRVRFGRCLLPERLRDAKKKQQDIADNLGYSKSLVSKWANNKKEMSGEALINISMYLDCHPNDLYELILDDYDPEHP